LQEVGVNASGFGVDEARVGLKVGAELLLELAVLEEEPGGWMVHLEERPDPCVGELYP
jgi:hypothetical protein